MDKPFRFAIPESMSSVLDWFTEALELEVGRFGNSGVEFSVEGPRSRTLHGSDGHTTVMEIVILGFRTFGQAHPVGLGAGVPASLEWRVCGNRWDP